MIIEWSYGRVQPAAQWWSPNSWEYIAWPARQPAIISHSTSLAGGIIMKDVGTNNLSHIVSNASLTTIRNADSGSTEIQDNSSGGIVIKDG